jgi:ubiquinone/menaquinone biosynthesis C-methylase UbiE
MSHDRIVHTEFTKQAAFFGNSGLTLSSQEYLAWMASQLPLAPGLRILDVAAGTGHLSRAVAPGVKTVVAVDLTPAMLGEAVRETTRSGLRNIAFERGDAARLPHPDSTFDMIVSRLAIHHFERPEPQLAEMVRVCKPGGVVGVIDLLSPDDEALIGRYNHLERLRDPSHTTALTLAQMVRAMQAAGLAVTQTDSRDIAVEFQRWVEMTGTDRPTIETIEAALRAEISGGAPTGMRPYLDDAKLKFLQIWSVVIGVKPGSGTARG